jgi:thiamine biosynthesis lipoprotein
LSRFQPESELSRLNAAAGLRTSVSPLLLRVLVAALDAARSTRGVFDPTILQRMIEIGYDRSFETLAAQLPASIYSRPAATGGWRNIEVDEARGLVRLPAGVGLDFGGIAKGMAVDAALDLLEREGLTPALVNAGGDLATRGVPPGADSWALTVPGKAQGWVIGLTRGALATSGVARRRWTQGGRERHHLIDPRTGEPANSSLWSVTATADTCAQAEVAAKTALILGEPAGAAFIEEIRLGALLARESGEWSVAGNWPRDGMRPLDQGASAWQGEIA